MNAQQMKAVLDAIDVIQGVMKLEIDEQLGKAATTMKEFKEEEDDCEYEASCEYCNDDSCPHYKGE